MNKSVNLKVNGKEIKLNRFVSSVFVEVVNGLIDSLNQIPENKDKIEICIEKTI